MVLIRWLQKSPGKSWKIPASVLSAYLMSPSPWFTNLLWRIYNIWPTLSIYKNEFKKDYIFSYLHQLDTPSPFVGQCQKLPDPPPPFDSQSQHLYTPQPPAPPFGSWHNLWTSPYLWGISERAFGPSAGFCWARLESWASNSSGSSLGLSPEVDLDISPVIFCLLSTPTDSYFTPVLSSLLSSLL